MVYYVFVVLSSLPSLFDLIGVFILFALFIIYAYLERGFRMLYERRRREKPHEEGKLVN